MSEWQPIENAPKYCDPIDIWGKHGRTPDCTHGKPTYQDGIGWIYQSGYDSDGPVFELVVKPTHWMPLPKAPEGTR